MTPDDTRHGSKAGAVQHWKDGERACDSCQAAARRDRKAQELDALAGKPRMVSLGEHAYGIVVATPFPLLEAASGVHRNRLAKLSAKGPDARGYRRTRDRILAAAATTTLWTTVGVVRRLQALMRIGWSMRALAAEVGVYESTLQEALRTADTRQFVRSTLAAAVVDAYDRLHLTSPEGRGASRARATAASRGYAPPLAWDDIDNDLEPPDGDGVHLDEVVVDRILGGERLPANPAERAEAIRRWTTAGRPLSELERITGWNTARELRRANEGKAA